MSKLIQFIKDPSFFLGFLFICFNIYVNHAFYHGNSYKIVFLGSATVFYFLCLHINYLFKASKVESKFLFFFLLFLFIPLLSTLPGFLIHGGNVNYNFKYELASFIFLIIWAGFIYTQVKEIKNVNCLLIMIGLSTISVSIIAFFEKGGVVLTDVVINFIDRPGIYYEHIFKSVDRVKATFGNINYFAGFLLLVIPVFLSFSIPNYDSKLRKFQKFQKIHVFFITCFLFACISLFLTQTRAAIFAWLLSLIFFGMIYLLYILPIRFRRILFIFYCFVFVVILIVSGIGVIYYSDYQELIISTNAADNLSNSLLIRFHGLFSGDVWEGRFVAWRAAFASFLDAPLFGYGLGSSYNLFFEFIAPESRILHGQRSYNHAHSEILEFIQEGGIFGLLCYIAFWGILFWILWKNIFYSQQESSWNKLALGILAAFIAYHIQGVFSVAPRMMVVRLPLYTWIGLVFCLSYIPFKQTFFYKVSGIKKSILNFVPIGFLLLIGWLLYAPWMISQYKHTKALKERIPRKKIALLEQIKQEEPNSYALNDLLVKQVAYREYDKAKDTIQELEKVIANYRTVRFIEAYLEYIQGNFDIAQQKSIEVKKRDIYLISNLQLLARIAAIQENETLFIEQLQSAFEFWMITSKVSSNIKKPEQIIFKITKNQPQWLNIIEKDEFFEILVKEEWVHFLMKKTRTLSHKKRNITDEYTQFTQTTNQAISSIRYFHLPFNRSVSNTTKEEIVQKINRYYKVSELLKNASKSNEQLLEEHKKLELFIRKYSNWDLFLKRRSLANQILQWINGLPLPYIQE